MTGAQERARAIDAASLAADPTLLERAVLEGSAGYLAHVDELATASSERIRDRRSALIQTLRDDAATTARAPRERIPWYRVVALLLAYLAAAATFALYFSRADLDLAVSSPVAMCFAAASALLYALACLPVRRSSPPPAAVAFAGWVLAVLTATAVGFAAYLVLSFEPATAPWLVVGVAAVATIVALAAWCAWARRGLESEARPPRTDREGDDLTARLASFVAEERDASARAVRDLYAGLADDERTALEADRDAARAALADRGLEAPIGDPVGAGIVARAVERAARSVGVR